MQCLDCFDGCDAQHLDCFKASGGEDPTCDEDLEECRTECVQALGCDPP